MKLVRVQAEEIRFPPICAVCLRPAEHTFPLERTFSFYAAIPLEQTVYLRRPLVVRTEMPLCPVHHAEAMQKSTAERIVEKAGLVMGMAAGLAVGGGLFAKWTFEQQGNSVMNLLLAAVMGIGFFLIVWLATAHWLAPEFVGKATRKARNAVRFTGYWPSSGVWQFEVMNDAWADLLMRENESPHEQPRDAERREMGSEDGFIHPAARGWSLVYEWNEGSAPPPYYYEYTLRIESEGRAQILFRPDYPAHDPPLWVETFLIPPEHCRRLEALVYKTVAEGPQSVTEKGRVGGSTSHIEIVLEDKTAFASGYFAEEAAGNLGTLCEAVRDEAPPIIWERLFAQREAYWQRQSGNQE